LGYFGGRKKRRFAAGKYQSPILNANRRFFLPPCEPKQNVIPNESTRTVSRISASVVDE